MVRSLLINDTRSVAFLTSVVLARVRQRQGDTIVPYLPEKLPIHTEEFWGQLSLHLPLSGIDEVILCCMTFDSYNPQRCIDRLHAFEAETGRPPVILSHRWPDGYENTGYKVIVPPFELVEMYASELQPEERELLRLSVIISRQADRSLIAEQEFQFSERLATAIWRSPHDYWNHLTNDLTQTLHKVRTTPTIGADAPITSKGTLESAGDAYALFRLEPSMEGHAEKTIAELLRYYKAPPEKLGLGVLESTDDIHVFAVQSWETKAPAVDWLLDRYSREARLPPPAQWRGPQRARSLSFRRAGLKSADLPELKANLMHFAQLAHQNRYGERAPVAGLSRLIHLAANRALESLDLTRTYTALNDPQLEFTPEKTRVLIEPSNRTNELRETLVLRLEVKSAGAAAFLFKHEGYNLLKLERLLEGVVIGIGTQRSNWLGSLDIPARLRIDPRIAEIVLENMAEAMTNKKEVTTITLDHAERSQILRAESTIFRALREIDVNGNGELVIWRESETIGPSVQYAFAVASIAESISKGDQIEILDLFSGSGLSARMLAKHVTWRVFCVDNAVENRQRLKNIIWLKADVREVIRRTGGVLNRDYDLVCMDPPHAALFELLFGKGEGGLAAIDDIGKIAPWLVVYQGHASQEGRGIALAVALQLRYSNITLWQIGPEVITIAGPADWNGKPYYEFIERARSSIEQDCRRFGWTFDERMLAGALPQT